LGLPSSLGSLLVFTGVSTLLALGCSPSDEPGDGSGGSGNQGTAGVGVSGSGTGTSGSGSGMAGSPSGGSTAGAGAPSGGTTGSSGGPAAGGSGGAAPACTPDLTNLVNKNAWVCAKDTNIAMQGSWYGYGDNTSCTPASNICATGACCISGATVTPDEMFTQWGCGIGLELNSSGGMMPTKLPYDGTVKCFDLELTGSSGKNVVRIGFTQSSDTTGKVSPFVEIPPFTSGWKGQVCFTDAECPTWAVTGGQCTKPVGMPGTPHDMQIQVSAGATTASDFNVCVSKVAPVTMTMGGGTTNSCSSVTGQGSISEQFGTGRVTCNGKEYIVQNNAWGSTAGQTITYGPGTKMKVTAQNGTGMNGAPASYPSIFIGSNAGRTTADSGLPKAVSALTAGTAKTSWSWAANGATGSYNASYDVWFSTTSAGDSGAVPSGGYLMVWYHKPPDHQPIGTSMANATIGGRTWSVWFGNNEQTGKPCVSYVAQQTINSLEFSLGDFIQDAVQRNYVQSTWYLTNVFTGFEIWSGGVGLETTDFAVSP
ncbi:MAG TPA: hypothetical protein VIM73_03145, partial [Polyangiaceae bacterium]